MKQNNDNQSRLPLLEAVNRLIDTNPAYFRIPGHRLERGICSEWTKRVGSGIFAYDVTETPYTDDLHAPEGAIREAQELMAKLYGADRSFFLVNGTTCGNEAMILSSVFGGEKIMVARNAHKSAMMGLILSGAVPVYIMPRVIDEWGLQGGIAPEDVRAAFEKNPDCKALFMVNPSYYGISSDIEEISRVCHEYGALLLVDEAHGGHVYFESGNDALFPKGALRSGADMCVQSMHKVTGALTQSSVLHIRQSADNKIDARKVASSLQLVQSTSPSYLLMTSLDCARYELAHRGGEMLCDALRLSGYAREEIRKIKGFRCMGTEIIDEKMQAEKMTGNGNEGEGCNYKNAVKALDTTRLVISAKELGLTGYELDELLFERFQVNTELADYENVLAIVTYANTTEDIERLIDACRHISDENINKNHKENHKKNSEEFSLEYNKHMFDKRDGNITEEKAGLKGFPKLPMQAMTPREAYFAQKSNVLWENCIGGISGEMIAPYPPGIPVIYPGEIITREIWEYVERFRIDGRHIHGPSDKSLSKIQVVRPE